MKNISVHIERKFQCCEDNLLPHSQIELLERRFPEVAWNGLDGQFSLASAIISQEGKWMEFECKEKKEDWAVWVWFRKCEICNLEETRDVLQLSGENISIIR